MLFTDVDARTIHELKSDGTIGVFHQGTNYANGLTFDRQGRLLMAEMGGTGSGRISRMDASGKLEIVLDKGPSGGALGTTDDLVVRSDGTIYFTDPVFPHGPSTAVSLFSRPIHRLPGGAMAPVNEDSTTGPNGIELSPDEKLLYVASYFGGTLLRFEVAADGALGEPRTLASNLTEADSLCVDAAGNLYVGISSGLAVLRPDGMRVTVIRISGDAVTNCGFGGADGKTLYITAWRSLYKIEGAPIPGLEWQINQAIDCAP